MLEIKNRHSIDVFFVLCIFLIFSMTLLGMLFLSARTQQKINQHSSDNFQMRTSLLYLSNKAKLFNEAGCIRIEAIQGEDTLVFEEIIDGKHYTTRVYYLKGHLMELFSEKNTELPLTSGTVITDIATFNILPLSDGLIQVEVEGLNGHKNTIIVSNLKESR